MNKTFAFNGFAPLVLAVTPLVAFMLAVYAQASGQI